MARSVAQLKSRALISVTGEDWRSFLQGLITQDVVSLQPGEIRYGALLTPQGRLLNDLFVIGVEEGACLDVAAEVRDGLVAKLGLYRLRAKVQIAPSPYTVFAAWGASSPPSDGWIADPRLADLGWRAVGASPQELLPEAAYEGHRLALGIPDPARDGVDSDYPIELNLDLLNGIDFKKGCFVGQETTSRMHRRGVVKTRMAPVTYEGPPPAFGAEITAGGLRTGEVRGALGDSAGGRAMALLRIDRAQGAALTVEGRAVTLDPPPWLARWFDQAEETP